MTSADHQGLLAFGDSITNGGGELQWGVALQSWAQWLARGLGIPFTNYAVDGARAHDVTMLQIPAHRQINAVSEPHYQLGCLYIGVNDVRALDWDPVPYERHVAEALNYLSGICGRLLTVTIPVDLGHPLAGPPVLEANVIIERQAQRVGALVLDLRGLRGREWVMFDHVHLTAMGQIEVAERAITLLEFNGWPPRVHPRTLAQPHDPLKYRVRGVLTYGYRSAKQRLKIQAGGRLGGGSEP